MLKQVEAVLFDLDGTLVDSMWMWNRIDREYLGQFHISLPDDLQGKIEGMSFTETALYFKERFQIPDSIEQMKQTWNEMAIDKYRHEVPMKSGAIEFLELLKRKGIKMGIATSNSVELVSVIIKKYHLDHYIGAIHTACEVEKGKPAPDIYLYVADKLQTHPECCLVFEDIIQGIMAGKNAGMKVCAVEDEFSAGQKEEKKRLADYYIESFSQLLTE